MNKVIIARYIVREVLYTFVITLFILTFIFITNQFVKLLSKIAIGVFPVSMALKIVFLFIPEFMQVLIPLSFFISILIVHGRLHADNEFIVLFTCNYSWLMLIRLIILLSLLISIFVAFLSLWIVPNIVVFRETIFAKSEVNGFIHFISPGRFQQIENGNVIFYISDKKSDMEMEEIFIVEYKGDLNKPNNIVVSEKAMLQSVENGHHNFFLTLKSGWRYFGIPGSTEFIITNFKEYGRELMNDINMILSDTKFMSTMSLWESNNLNEIAELYWRFSLPISVIVLSVIAVPLSQVKNGQERLRKLLIGIVIYIIYYNLITLSHRLIISGNLSLIVGTLLVHIIFLLFGVILFLYTSNKSIN